MGPSSPGFVLAERRHQTQAGAGARGSRGVGGMGTEQGLVLEAGGWLA